MIVPAKLAGRCANGYERGQGSVIHAVQIPEGQKEIGFYARSLCGKTHGARSAGWSGRIGEEVTCPKCVKRSLLPQRSESPGGKNG